MFLFGGFELGKTHLSFENIKKEREVSVFSWAWGDNKVQAEHFNLNKFNLSKYDDDADKELLKKASDLMSTADLVLGHNERAFDIAVMRSRLVKHKLPDFTPVLLDDTYEQTKPIGFPSHKLDYLGKYLGEGRKVEHGIELWMGILNKDKKALDKQTEYCKGDVELLRKIYKRLKPYTKSTLNLAIFSGNSRNCPHCGSEETLIQRGYGYTTAGKYTRYQCKSCGHWSRDGKNEIVKPSNYKR